MTMNHHQLARSKSNGSPDFLRRSVLRQGHAALLSLACTALLLGTLALAAPTAIAESAVNIIPAPVKLAVGAKTLTITPETAIHALPGTEQEAVLLKDYLQKLHGIALPIGEPQPASTAIVLQLQGGAGKPEAYQITTDDRRLVVSAADARGVFWGIQTLLQLIPTKDFKNNFRIEIPQVEVEDYPRFPYRGMLLDSARHFFAVDDVKRFIDYLAMHKFNFMQWHLTDDQGWRLEIKQYPRLTSVGGYRNGTIIGRRPGAGTTNKRYGGFYTQPQIRELVKYAAARHITIVPEIEMPGHASAAIAAYPELSCFPEESTLIPPGTAWVGPTTGKQVQQTWGVFPDVFCPKESTFTFLKNVLDEVSALFPSPYIHIGGDECFKEHWKRCPRCQRKIRERGLKDEFELQSYFIHTIAEHLNRRGKRIIGWEEILQGGLAPNATVMNWHGEETCIQTAMANRDVIVSPSAYVYFDYPQIQNETTVNVGGYLPLAKVYQFEPVPAKLDPSKARYVLGAQANVWTEYIPCMSKLEYMIFPRMSALGEVLWTPAENKDWDRFQDALPTLYRRYELWGAGYFKWGADVR